MVKPKAFFVCLLGLYSFNIHAFSEGENCYPYSVSIETAKYFINQKNGTVTDKRAGLIWKRCSQGQVWNSKTDKCVGNVTNYSWQAALQQAVITNKSGFAGKKDWRVPTIKEMLSIVIDNCDRSAFNDYVFPNSPTYGWYWTSSPYVADGNMAWFLDAGFGHTGGQNKTEHSMLRLVRN